MKGFTHILGFIIFFFSILPCADEAIGAVSGDEEVMEQLEEQGQEASHQHGEDLCSPFCSCHCCHTHVKPTAPFDLERPYVFFGSFYLPPPEEPRQAPSGVFRPPIA